VSSVCADAGDALATNHTAIASKPRRRKPAITAALVLMIGLERSITIFAPDHVSRLPTAYPPSRDDNPDQSLDRGDVAIFCAVFTLRAR
jgi:hypothetical protein